MKARTALEDRQGVDVVVLDVRGLSGITDFTVLVSGSSPPHVKALYNAVLRALKNDGVRSFRKAGDPDGGWMVVDYVDVVVHILSERNRAYYALEALWPEAKLVPGRGRPPSESGNTEAGARR